MAPQDSIIDISAPSIANNGITNDEIRDRTVTRRNWGRQHLAAWMANVATLSVGFAIGWSSPAQAVLRGDAPGSPLNLTLEQRSWASSLLPMGALFGAPPSGLLAGLIGRKRALLLGGSVPAAAGWLLILFAENRVWMLYLGRLLTGFSAGACILLVSLYSEEIAAVKTRGKIGSYLDMCVTMGMLGAYVFGAVLPYFWFTAIGLVPVVVFALGFCWMPESPAYLIETGRDEEARKALGWLRGPAIDVRPEFDEIKAAFKTKDTDEGCFTMPKIDKVTAKAVLIVLGIMFFTQANGVTGFVYYTTDVFKEAKTSISPDTATIIVGAVHVIGTIFPTLTVDRLGRRPLLSGTSIGLGLCLSMLSLYSYLQDSTGVDLNGWRWVPLACLLLYFFLISAGPGPLSWFMMAELLPPNAKGWGSAIAVSFSRGMSLLVTKVFPGALEALGRDVTYAAFAIVCFAFVAFILIVIPETRGRTRQEILEMLRGQSTDKTSPD